MEHIYKGEGFKILEAFPETRSQISAMFVGVFVVLFVGVGWQSMASPKKAAHHFLENCQLRNPKEGWRWGEGKISSRA